MRPVKLFFFVFLVMLLVLCSCTMLRPHDTPTIVVDVYNNVGTPGGEQSPYFTDVPQTSGRSNNIFDFIFGLTEPDSEGWQGWKTIIKETETPAPTQQPTAVPTQQPTAVPTQQPTAVPTQQPTAVPTQQPTAVPTQQPTAVPTQQPTAVPTQQPTAVPTQQPTAVPTAAPVEAGKHIIYLTFDDGPCQNTLRVLDILDQYGVKATFFTVGYFVDRYPEIVKETYERGHLVACHSYTHDFTKCYASTEAFMKEVKLWESAVTKAIGFVPWRVCVRFPGGSTTASAKRIIPDVFYALKNNGYRWFDWNAGNNDKWEAGNTENLPRFDYLMKSYRDSIRKYDNMDSCSVIFLCHDTEDATVDMLPYMLKDLIAKGYEFRVLNSHPDWHN